MQGCMYVRCARNGTGGRSRHVRENERLRSEEIRRILSERLVECRRRRGVAASVASELCGLGHDTLSRYESGEMEPKASALAAIADYYGVSVDWLLGGK